MIAVFPDGEEHILEDMTIDEYKLLEKTKASDATSKASLTFYKGELDGKLIFVQKRLTEGRYFFRLAEGKGQLDQLRANIINNDENKARDLMVQLAKDLVEKKITKADVKTEKAARLHKELAGNAPTPAGPKITKESCEGGPPAHEAGKDSTPKVVKEKSTGEQSKASAPKPSGATPQPPAKKAKTAQAPGPSAPSAPSASFQSTVSPVNFELPDFDI